MGQLIFSAICSLDGYIADRAGAFDWAVPDEAVLAEQSPGSAEFAAIWQAADKVVYSSTLEEVSTRRTRLARSFEAADVERLKRDSAADLYVDGPTLAAHAFGLGVVDRVHLVLCPVVVGGGLAALPADVRLTLRLDGEQRYDNGMVAVRYAIER